MLVNYKWSKKFKKVFKIANLGKLKNTQTIQSCSLNDSYFKEKTMQCIEIHQRLVLLDNKNLNIMFNWQ